MTSPDEMRQTANATILIVEDNDDIRQLLVTVLSPYFHTITAVDGREGLEVTRDVMPDIIISDVLMPHLSGLELCKMIKEDLSICHIPVILLTAQTALNQELEGLKIGADDYISKPFSPSELVARVKAHLARYERLIAKADKSLASFIEVGSLEIQPEGHRVFIRGKEISLTHKEFELLLFLARNRGIVFSKDALFERVWGLDAVGDTATVMVHVNRLREKLEKDPSKPEFIETVWGVGYRLK